MKLEIVEQDTGSRISFAFDAKCDGVLCGSIKAHRTKVRGKIVYKVDDVGVLGSFRRKGVATKLYEAAAAEACRRRGRLASTERLHEAHSTDFWEKQAAKGRVEVIPQRWPAEVRRHAPYARDRDAHIYILRDCPGRGRSVDLSGWKRKR